MSAANFSSDIPVMPVQSVPARASRLALLAIVLLAAIFRLAIFPHSDETRDVDEVGYLKGSLALLEGLSPGYKAAPAGPNTWVGWIYAGGQAAMQVVHPDASERRVAMAIRPFVAVDHVLFDNYRDLSRLHALWILTQLALAVWAAAAAYRYGAVHGGTIGGIFIGGFFAAMPLLVEFTDMSRPYMTAWAFGMLALSRAAADRGPRRVAISGIFLGLAIASRVEMLLWLPLVGWEFWQRREGAVSLFRVWVRLIAIAVVSALIAAPWLTTHLLGNLRTIFTVRLGPNPNGPTTLGELLVVLALGEGLIGPMVLCVVALFVQRRERRLRVILLGIYVGLLGLSMSRGTVYLHQQGPILLAMVVFSALGVGPLVERWPREMRYVIALLLILPAARTLRLINGVRHSYAPDPATQWVERHVPAGTRVYVQYSLRDPLPTEEASKILWDEVTNDEAWRLKFKSGAQRFGLPLDQIPRALSEENLAQERGNRRGFFILGSRSDLPDPRFDVRVFKGSPIFGVQDIAADFAKSGGVVVWRGTAPPPELGSPVVQWTNSAGEGCFICCGADVLPRLRRD